MNHEEIIKYIKINFKNRLDDNIAKTLYYMNIA